MSFLIIVTVTLCTTDMFTKKCELTTDLRKRLETDNELSCNRSRRLLSTKISADFDPVNINRHCTDTNLPTLNIPHNIVICISNFMSLYCRQCKRFQTM